MSDQAPSNNNDILSTEVDFDSQLVEVQKLLLEYAEKGDYDNAGLCTRKIDEIKANIAQKKKKDLEDQQFMEMNNLEQEYQEEIEKVNEKWNHRFQDWEERSQKADEQITERQSKEMDEVIEWFEKNYPSKPKASKELLELESSERQWVKLKRFDEAKVIQAKKEVQREKDEDKYLKEKNEKMKAKTMQKSHKHWLEKNNIKKKFETELDMLKVENKKEIEQIDKKYQNKKMDLEKQQKRERIDSLNNGKGRNMSINSSDKKKIINTNDKSERDDNEMNN